MSHFVGSLTSLYTLRSENVCPIYSSVTITRSHLKLRKHSVSTQGHSKPGLHLHSMPHRRNSTQDCPVGAGRLLSKMGRTFVETSHVE